MKTLIITTQEQLDNLKLVEQGQEVMIHSDLRLNCRLEVFGILRINANLDCSWNERYVVARGNSSVVARGNSSVVAWENSSVEARGNSSVVAWGNSSVVAWENSSVVARGNSSVVAWENSSVVAWENSCLRIFAAKAVSMFNFAVAFIPASLKLKIKHEKTCHIQRYKPLDFFTRHGLDKKSKSLILYKRVSTDFKTQENTENETLWEPGTTVTNPKWCPDKSECGEGKFHACPKPYFADQFRATRGDKYIAIEVNTKDLYEWKNNPQYPHKIGFREGKVLYECDGFGRQKV